jgi:F0F1-type ATP synthase membrane subunit c/vacuolar-type H+-ATPase subunit K
MQPLESKDAEIKTKGLYRTLLIIWFAFLLSIGVIALLSLTVLKPVATERNNSVLGFALGALGGFLFVLSLVIKNKVLARAIEQQSAARAQQAYIIAFALCETVALIGLIFHLLNNSMIQLVFFFIAIFGIVINMPRRSPLVAALSEKRI